MNFSTYVHIERPNSNLKPLNANVIQVWNVASGKQLTEIDNRRQPAPNQGHFFAVSPDWQTLYVGYRSLKLSTVPREKKPHWHFEPSGEVQAWDVETGQPRKGFAPVPSRGMEGINLSPDGSMLLTIQMPAGDFEKWPQLLPILWAESLCFSPDGKTLASSGDGRMLLWDLTTPPGQRK